MNILSLFDGMSCGMIALKKLNIPVDNYFAYEIDKYAIKVSSHNFPSIIQNGDVFKADFKQYLNKIDILMGGSPCQKWSVAQSKGREVKAEGVGWDLFSQYVRALNEALPRYFIYENNKSMSRDIKESITNTFGFEPVCINSSLLSAQNRQRLYWVGYLDKDGEYKKVNIEQPEELGIMLVDILDCEKARSLTDNEMDYMVREIHDGRNHFDFGYIQDATKLKGKCLTSNVSKGVPYNVCCEPVGICRNNKSYALTATYHKCYPKDAILKGKRTQVAIQVFDNIIKRDNVLYAIRVSENGTEYEYPVYEVKNGKILVKGQWHPINLIDGYYIIRKLSVNECKRLQTVPDWYDMSCLSDTRAYKCLGNGWTVDVIAHILKGILEMENKEV